MWPEYRYDHKNIVNHYNNFSDKQGLPNFDVLVSLDYIFYDV